MGKTFSGEELRRRREELGLTLDDLAERTRIRRTYLVALEEGRTDVFPGEAYLIGFLRNYARTLGLDDDAAVNRFREQTRGGSFVSHTAAVDILPAAAGARPRRPQPRRRSIVPAAVLLIVVLAAGAWLVRATFFPSPSEPGPAAKSVLILPAEPALRPAPDAAAAAAAAAAVPTTAAAGTQPVDASAAAPAVPAVGSDALLPAAGTQRAVLRVVGLERTELDIALDGRPAERHLLENRTDLQWDVTSEAQIRVGRPGAARFWLGGQEIFPNGAGELALTLPAGDPNGKEKP